MSQKLSPSQIKALRAQAHNLNPIVTIGQNGVTESVIAELDRSLEHHELLKVKIAIGDREVRKLIAEDLIKQSQSTLIQSIGKTLILYRKAQKAKIPSPA